MNTFHKGIAPLVIVLLIALGLAGGATAGYAFREPIKKAISGVTTAEEIQQAINSFKLGQSKFELEGVATSVDATNNILTVKIKSSTASIEELRLSETPITVTTTTSITSISSTSTSSLTIVDVPIDSQVHVGGTITEGVLTATKIIVQKEEANENKGEHFSVGGTVKEVGVGELTIDVKTANVKAKDKKGITVTIKTDSTTIIEKAKAIILLTDIKVGDEVHVVGVITANEYLANKIEVKIKEQAGELELEEETNTNQNQGNSDKNKETETEKNINSNANNNSGNANSNANKNN